MANYWKSKFCIFIFSLKNPLHQHYFFLGHEELVSTFSKGNPKNQVDDDCCSTADPKSKAAYTKEKHKK
jgi:hypothetical protein